MSEEKKRKRTDDTCVVVIVPHSDESYIFCARHDMLSSTMLADLEACANDESANDRLRGCSGAEFDTPEYKQIFETDDTFIERQANGAEYSYNYACEHGALCFGKLACPPWEFIEGKKVTNVSVCAVYMLEEDE